MLTPKAYQQAKTLLLTSAVVGAGVVMTLLIGYVMASPTFGWTGAHPLRSLPPAFLMSSLTDCATQRHVRMVNAAVLHAVFLACRPCHFIPQAHGTRLTVARLLRGERVKGHASPAHAWVSVNRLRIL